MSNFKFALLFVFGTPTVSVLIATLIVWWMDGELSPYAVTAISFSWVVPVLLFGVTILPVAWRNRKALEGKDE